MPRPLSTSVRWDRWVAPGLAGAIVVALVVWPILAGRLDGQWMLLLVPLLAGVGACAIGWSGAAVAIPLTVGAEYGISLANHRELDAAAVAEALGLMMLVELLAWTIEARDYAVEPGVLLRARALRLLALIFAVPVVAAIVLVASRLDGPSGVAALAVAVSAALAVLALVALPRRHT